jgi:hypothetical protein
MVLIIGAGWYRKYIVPSTMPLSFENFDFSLLFLNTSFGFSTQPEGDTTKKILTFHF